ncbi:MAG TPA: molybdopterin-dependent oxidoreductase [Mycobacteriales bacterium]
MSDDELGFPKPLFRRLRTLPAVGPFRPATWRSPLRGPWLTSVFAIVLLVGLPLVTITGLLSYIAYGPQFHQAIPGHVGWLHLPYFAWPTRPVWLYRFTQGLHVALGLALVPVVLAKLWSVIPKLFTWPPAKTLAQVVERLSLALLVGSILFELATGLLNIQYDYIFGFDFYTAHYYGAWVFIAAFLTHVAIKFPAMRRGLRARSLRRELRTGLADTTADAYEPDGLAPQAPARATISRRGALGLVAGSSLAILAFELGSTLNPLRFTALLTSRGQSYGGGPGHFQVNRSAATARITPADTDDTWRLTLVGNRGEAVSLSRTQLLSMPQHRASLPIACVEGWSTEQHWQGIRLRELAALVGVGRPTYAHVRSLEKRGAFNQATLNTDACRDPDAMLALKVAGDDLLPDHGYPARIIVPALPGVHNTKWVSSIAFHGAA